MRRDQFTRLLESLKGPISLGCAVAHCEAGNRLYPEHYMYLRGQGYNQYEVLLHTTGLAR